MEKFGPDDMPPIECGEKYLMFRDHLRQCPAKRRAGRLEALQQARSQEAYGSGGTRVVLQDQIIARPVDQEGVGHISCKAYGAIAAVRVQSILNEIE